MYSCLKGNNVRKEFCGTSVLGRDGPAEPIPA